MARKLAAELNLPVPVVSQMVDETLNIVIDKARIGHIVSIRNFANFKATMKKSRPARNPKTGEPHEVKPRLRLTASFSATKFK